MVRTGIQTSEVSIVNDLTDYIMAVRAADTMAKTWKADVAILSNLKVVRLDEAEGTVLEIVRGEFYA
jgi:DUF1009 family protein